MKANFESLERRRLLAYVTWDNGGDGASWSDPLNWSENVVPQTGDSVFISSASHEVVLTEDVSLGGLVVYSAGLTVDSATVTCEDGVAIDWGHIYIKNGSVLHSSGETITVDGGLSIGRPGDTVPSRLVLDGAFNDFNGEGGIGFNAGSVLDLTGVNVPRVSVSHRFFISGAIIEAPADYEFSGGGNSTLYGVTTTGPLQLNYMSISGTITLGGDLSIIGAQEVPFGVANDVKIRGPHIVSVFDEGFGDWSRFYGEFPSNAELRIAPETEMRIYASGEFFSSGFGASILNQGRLIFDGSDTNLVDDFQVKVNVINLGTIEVVNGAHVTFDQLIGNGNEMSVSGVNTNLALDGDYELNNMTVGVGASLFLAESSWQNDMSMDVNGTVIFDHDGSASNFNFIRAMVEAGYAFGTWNGGGLRDSLAATEPKFTLGYAASNVILGENGGSFAGVDVDSTAVIVHHTLDADFNLDNVVNFPDLLKVAKNFNTGGKNFTDGDTDFNSWVNFNDLLRVSQLYGQSMFSNSLIPKTVKGLDDQKRMTGHRSVIA